MNNNKTAVIIGAGIGGITTSIYLARAGYQVTLYEKGAGPGGRCSQILREGYRFDLGATIFLMPEVYRQEFSRLGLHLEESLHTRPLQTLYTIHFGDGTSLEFTPEESRMEIQLENLEKGSYLRSKKLITIGYSMFRLAMEKLLGRNFVRLTEFITLRNAFLLIRLKTLIRHSTYVRRYFRNPNLQKAFTFQNIYVGQNPETAPALFCMLPAAELTEGSVFPEGGMYTIVRKLTSVAREAGAQFVYNTTVIRILTNRKKVAGVVLEDGSMISADVVIANADLPYVYRELLPDTPYAAHIERLRYSCSAIVMHWGVDKVYPQLSHHNVFLSPDYRNNLRRIFLDQSVSSNPSFYVHAPVRTDATAAPDGHDALSVIIPCGHLHPKHAQNWNALKNEVRTAVIDRLKSCGLTDIEEHIRTEIIYLPQTWKSVYNLTRGATFGSLGHQIFQMGYFRPHNRHPRYQNLYFTGGSTHPGNGIPLVLISGRLTAERILNAL